MKAILPAYVAATNFIADRKSQLKQRDDRGAEFVEWGAMLLVIAAIVAVLVGSTDIQDAIETGIKDAVDLVFEKGQG
jgi:cbb3-type cytochrome oxidase subunit 1